MKVAALINAMRQHGDSFQQTPVHTGQHYKYNIYR
jgi:UDP-N-acetylglucosamine 2-epimerase